MARTTNQNKNPEILQPPKLLISRQEAELQIKSRIVRGAEIENPLTKFLESPNTSEDINLEELQKQYNIWNSYNSDLLSRIFDNVSEANKYTRYPRLFIAGNTSLKGKIKDLKDDISLYKERLESLLERLVLIPESSQIQTPNKKQEIPQTLSNKVFIVHGRDLPTQIMVARFLEKLGFEAIALYEQTNQGRTVIEKFEDHTDVAFAIILLTPDDIGALREENPNLHPRARQNVIFEHGFFLGKLGRKRVCALTKGGVEIPSDVNGILNHSLDRDDWQLPLAKEMKAAGLEVDMNKLF